MEQPLVPAARPVFSAEDRARIADLIDTSLQTGSLTLGPTGKQFEETRAFEMIKDKLTGVVRIKQRGSANNVLHLNAMREMTRRHLTYKEVLASPEFSIWDRQRLRDAQREVYDQLLAMFGCEDSAVTAPGVTH